MKKKTKISMIIKYYLTTTIFQKIETYLSIQKKRKKHPDSKTKTKSKKRKMKIKRVKT